MKDLKLQLAHIILSENIQAPFSKKPEFYKSYLGKYYDSVPSLVAIQSALDGLDNDQTASQYDQNNGFIIEEPEQYFDGF